jgi:regulator of sigma E protease
MLSTIIIAFVTLGVIIFVHELGHFLVAKRSGADVLEFGFGFPPRIFGVRRGKTLYSLNWIPVGGFVKILGEDGSLRDTPGSFASLPIAKRFMILVAGVTMNAIFAMFLFSLLFAYGAPTAIDGGVPSNATVKNRQIQILGVVDPSPASRTGMKVGDVVLSVDSQTLNTVSDIQKYNAEHQGLQQNVTVRRQNKTMTFVITPEAIQGSDVAVWGVNLATIASVSFPWYQAYWYGIQQTFSLMWQMVLALFAIIQNLLVHQNIPSDIAGPVGIASLAGQMGKLGVLYLVQFTAFLSLNLALLNILPIPALDGGRILFLCIEKIRGRKINVRAESLVHNVGFTLLLLLVLLVTIRDIEKLTGGFIHFFRNIISR